MRALQRRGTHVVGLSRSPSEADEHEECDVGDRDAVYAAAARVLERHPKIDLLVCNAGVGARGSFLTAEPERIEQVIRVNYLGAAWTTLAFLPGLGDGSHLVNVVSVAGMFADGPYSASKHAQLALSRSLAVELAPRGIRVNAVAPGFFVGEQNRALLLDDSGGLTVRGERIVAATPAGRFGEPHELADAVVWLCGDKASFVTGAVIPVDGGFDAFSGI